MDDLRWILLMVGGVIIAAIYFSGRFECEDWLRERKERKAREAVAKNKTGKTPRVRPKMNGKPGHAVTKPQQSGAAREPVSTPESHARENTNQAGKKSQGQEVSAISSEKVKPQSSAAEKKIVEKKEPTFAEAKTTEAPPKKTPSKKAPPKKENQSVPSGFVPSPNVPVDKPLADEVLRKTKIQEKSGGAAEEDETIDVSVMSSIEDEIVVVEMPMDLIEAEAELKAEQEQDDPVLNEPVQGSLPLGIEPLVLVVTVVAEDGQHFTGPEIQEALELEGLVFGDMNIFHYHVEGYKDAVFSAANIIEPGFFDVEKIAELKTPGLSIFCQLPGPLPGNEALDIMLDKGRGIAVRLYGRMCDDKRNMFTAQATTHYKDRIAAFDHELDLARKKGS